MKPMLTRIVQGRAYACDMSRDTAHVHQAAGHLVPGPVPDGQLAQPDRVGQVHVEHGVRARVVVRRVPAWRVRVRGRLGRVPEVGEERLEEPGARADDVDARERGHPLVEEGRQLRPRRHVCGVEEGRRLLAVRRRVRILREELLGLWPQAQVAD
jgi:hypothetical protein